MKKRTIAGIFIAAALAAAVGIGAFYMRSLEDSGGFLHGTRLNGIDVSGWTPEEAAATIAEGALDGEAVVMEGGREVLRMPLTELGYGVNMEKLEKALTDFMNSEKGDSNEILQGLKSGNSYTVDVTYTIDKNKFAGAVKVDALSEPRKKNKDAKILYHEKEKEVRILPEVQGTELEDETLQNWLRGEIDSVLTGKTAASEDPGAAETGQAAESNSDAAGKEQTAAADSGAALTIVRTIPASLYVRPEKTADDEKMQKKCEILNRYAGESITYLFGNVTETLDFSTIIDWLKIRDGEVEVREEKVREYVRQLAEKYETRYRDRVFTTTWGSVVTFPAGLNEYGYTILEDLEAEQLTQDILSGENIEREPVYMAYGAWGDPLYLYRNGMDDLVGTYVEVSISAQHMWYYLNGTLIVESDVVTGDIQEGMGTATGVFPLAFKESPATLRGGEGKNKYETKVQYWMPFYEGQGLHDASWKSVFGGTEYIGNGSHGCVNLPPWVAETLYYNIVPGTAIIIYN